MTDFSPVSRARSTATYAAVGAALVALAIIVSLSMRQWGIAGLAGAAGVAMWRQAKLGRWTSTVLPLDVFAFAILGYQRNDYLSLWQLVGPWGDVFRFNAVGAAIGYGFYVVGTLLALRSQYRSLRPVEAIAMIAIPFMFNQLVNMGADWHMAEIANELVPFNGWPFPYQVFLGRAVVLFVLAELGLAGLSLIELDRWPRSPRTHGLLFACAVFGAATPLIANSAQLVAQPFFAIFVGALAAAIVQGALWSVTYVATGLPLDALAGRPPRFLALYQHARDGAIKGAIYGGVFMALILAFAFVLGLPGVADVLRAGYWVLGPVLGALAFPFLQTLIGSADGTPPFVGRLNAAYRDGLAYARGVVVGLGCAYAYAVDLAAQSGGARFLIAFVIGAIAYAGVDLIGDALRIQQSERVKLQTWRRYALGLALGGVVAGALGWYFDTAQLAKVLGKFWAYADVNYRLSGRALGDYTTYPLFNKFGAMDLGEVAGGVRLFFAESLAGVINWSIAAPLFSINYVLLAALLDRSLKPLREMFSAQGMEGLIAQAVRVMRWGLWMSPIINTFLRQSADPSWYNQDGAVRSLVAIGADIGLPAEHFRDFSLTLFLGLLAYDWLRVLIWFDHMGLRVATLVNLSFLGGDRADEAAGRFLGAGSRTRVIPDGIRRFGTWAPLLLPFYIPRGPEWDKAWTGAETLAKGGPMPEPIKILSIVYAVAIAGIIGATFYIIALMRNRATAAAIPLEGAPATLADTPQRFSLFNPAVGVEVWRDGRGAASVMADERGGPAIDLIRRPLDPQQSRGPFFYVCEEGQAPWSIGFEPARRAGEYSVERTGFNQVTITHLFNGVRASLVIGPDHDAAVLSFRVALVDVSGRARSLRLVSFCEIAGHETGAYAGDLDFAGMHVETSFIRGLNGILARNRLLRSARAGRGETSFFAVKPGPGAKLIGYEDSRTRFLGEGSLIAPTGCEPFRSRKLDDQGKLWTFDPAASFTLDIPLEANGVEDAEFIIGRADNAVWAAELVSKRLGLPSLAEGDLQHWMHETRAVEPSPALHVRWPFSFSQDGKTLHLTHRTPRPWAHVMGNDVGGSVMVSSDGEVYSSFANARQNGLTPFRFDSAHVQQPGQVIYIRDLDRNETDSPGYVPFQYDDAAIEVDYEPGVATFRKRRGALATIYEVFTPPDFPGDMRLLSLHNAGDEPLNLRVAPFFDMALEESPNASAGKIAAQAAGAVLLFSNPRNDFVRGTCFVATSLENPALETVRTRFFGGIGRDIHSPAFVERDVGDLSQRDDGRRVAAFAQNITLAPGETRKIALVIGQAPDRAAALKFAEQANVATVERQLAETRRSWAQRLGVIEVRTNRPDFDRLVNIWLPYQLYASRLFARVGPNQRGGATGYRDQLQDVIPLIVTEPALARRQIVIHAGQQFLEGDVLKWWHWAPNGATGIGQRTKASDPHLWLPYVLARYVAQTGDAGVLDVNVAYLEGLEVPANEDTFVIAPRASRESADVYGHSKRAIEYTMGHMGADGLPLLGAGDWNDGIDELSRHGPATGVWMGFFFYNVLDGFIPLARRRGDEVFAKRCEQARQSVRAALDLGWRGDHYALDLLGDGGALDMPNAMAAGWAAYSGAVPYARAVDALEGALKGIERPHRVLLLEKPFFEHSDPYPGRIADYPPGVRENGGQYSHGASWIIDGFVRVAAEAHAMGDEAAAARLHARAFEIFEKISPLKKTDPEHLAHYGLIPIQQPADIYEGYGHGGRGGWSWYTGSAARMVSAAYGLLGISKTNGEIQVADDLFESKGALQVESLRIGEVWRRRDAAHEAPAPVAFIQEAE